MAGFTFTLELEDGTPGSSTRPTHRRPQLERWRHDPAPEPKSKADRPQAESAMSRTISMPGAGLEPARPRGGHLILSRPC